MEPFDLVGGELTGGRAQGRQVDASMPPAGAAAALREQSRDVRSRTSSCARTRGRSRL